ncbi:MAG: hypothetical protein JW966_08405 [Anaerolineae bacterium]|nr:hypothetical protein [Anaerolineae bacterium]
MGLLKKKKRSDQSRDNTHASTQIGFNPARDEYLYWLTQDGYIIAQDAACQYEYVQTTVCPHCNDAPLIVMAHLNRAGQGLSEMVAICPNCRERSNFIFDISNDVYQTWWAEQLGSLYVQQYDGPPREPYEST